MPQRESFSSQIPGLQTAMDSTSIGEAKLCWEKYRLSIIEGWTRPAESIDLDFGIHFHSACEAIDRAKAAGANHRESLQSGVDQALSATWNKDLERPWASTDPQKNRGTLIRSIIWYHENFQSDSLKTVILANGQPAVELSFSFDSGYRSRLTGESFLLCGHLDRLVEFNGGVWVTDKKTTRFTLNSAYFGRFSPDNQISCYSLAGEVVFSAPISGVIIDAVQVAASFTRFQRGFVSRSKPQLAEWLRDLYVLFEGIERNVERNHYPRNDRACGIPHIDSKSGELRHGCQFREICSADPAIREKLLELNFRRRSWDPIKPRGIPHA